MRWPTPYQAALMFLIFALMFGAWIYQRVTGETLLNGPPALHPSSYIEPATRDAGALGKAGPASLRT